MPKHYYFVPVKISYKSLPREEKARLYERVLKLHKEKKLGADKIAKKLGLKVSLIRGWLYKGNKPTVIKKKIIKIEGSDLEQILLGSLLGDGSLEFTGRCKSPMYYEGHSLKQEDYLKWKWNYFKIFGGHVVSRNVFNKYRNRTYSRIEMYTNSNPTFDYYYRLFYPGGMKKISEEILDKLKPLALAIWHCDDGHLDLLKGEIILGTYTTYEENLLVQRWFKKEFGLECKIRKRRNNRYVIVFNPENSKKFIALIKDHVPKCMDYKINYDEKVIRKKQKLRNKRNYLKHRQKRLKWQREYYHKNKEKRKKYNREWVKRNREKVRKYNRIYIRKWRERNKAINTFRLLFK